jgi:type IV fimbrial biogenesis protein FimT
VLGSQERADVLMRVRPAIAGFTLIELLVAISVIALLVTLSVPSFRTWTANQQTRAVAETVQNALRLAQANAVHQGRLTTLCFTNSTPSSSLVTGTTATGNANCTTNGKNWFIEMDRLFTSGSGVGTTAEYVQGGTFGNISPNVTITTDAANPVSFNSLGRTNVGATVTYEFTNPYGDFKDTATRALKLMIDTGGQIRLCDSARNITSSPDGCP